MANLFSANFWKSRFFKAFGVQGAVDPNAMSGSFAGVASFTGTLDQPEGAIAGSFAGASEFTGTITAADDLGGRLIRGRKRKRRRWVADFVPQPYHPDDDYVYGPRKLEPPPKAAPEVVELPRRVNGGFLSRIAKAPEYNQVVILQQLTEQAVVAESAQTLRHLNRTLKALSIETVKRQRNEARVRNDLLQLKRALAMREAEILREMDDEDEIVLLLAA